jgi:hypothetical protein
LLNLKPSAGAGLQPGPDVYNKFFHPRYRLDDLPAVDANGFVINAWFNLQD